MATQQITSSSNVTAFPPPARRRSALGSVGYGIATLARWLVGPAWTAATLLLRRTIDVALQAAGLALLAVAAWTLAPAAGIAAAGVALLVLQALNRPDTMTVDVDHVRAMLDAARRGATDEQILGQEP